MTRTPRPLTRTVILLVLLAMGAGAHIAKAAGGGYSAILVDQATAEFIFRYDAGPGAVERMLKRFAQDNQLELTIRRPRAANHTSLLAIIEGRTFGESMVSNAANAEKYYCSYFPHGVADYPEATLGAFKQRFLDVGGHLTKELIGEEAVRKFRGDE